MRRARPGMSMLCGALVAMVLPATAAGEGAEPAATGTPLSADVAYYPTTVRLAHAGEENGAVLTATVSFGSGGGSVPIYESTDDGATFDEVGRITDDGFGEGLCCGSLLELPGAVGDLPEGTLLWTGSAGADQETDRRMRLPVFESRDRGRSWTQLSTCATGTGTGGMWEPELAVDSAGTLGCYYADENQPGHSQVLHRTTSTDGVNWSAPEPVVQVPEGDLRPGMAVVRPLPDGRYYLSYEICGGGDPYHCAAYFRLSDDGSDWGDPAAHGTLLATEDGRFFAHAPKITVTPDGKVVTVGQELKHADGTVAEGNGATLFVTDRPGSSTPTAIPAPVEVPAARDDPCPNYSSSLLPVGEDRILEIATDYDDGGACKAYFATGDL
ncbi:sialidase family protein [Saccharopolyspora sp. NPDC047091]|uniref:sialidase family protein n=1 Tax=Saccharopolyspora sp. NPDC047091 TaxID=3155924 RepID=UPI003404AAC2